MAMRLQPGPPKRPNASPRQDQVRFQAQLM
jgi:hypothetical protein